MLRSKTTDLPKLVTTSKSDPRAQKLTLLQAAQLVNSSSALAPVHPVLSTAARRVNDAVSDRRRHLLWPYLASLVDSYDVVEDPMISVQLACWCTTRAANALGADPALDLAHAVQTWAHEPTLEDAAAIEASPAMSSDRQGPADLAAHQCVQTMSLAAARTASGSTVTLGAIARAAAATASDAVDALLERAGGDRKNADSLLTRYLRDLAHEFAHLSGTRPSWCDRSDVGALLARR